MGPRFAPGTTTTPAPTRRAGHVILGLAMIANAGCITAVGSPSGTGPTVGGTGPGTGSSRTLQMCRVNVANQTGTYLDVTWRSTSTDGPGQRGSMGRIEPGDSRSTSVRCGDSLTAFGRGGGRNVQGSVVARRLDDNWIRLTDKAPTPLPASRFAGLARQHRVRGRVAVWAAWRPRATGAVARASKGLRPWIARRSAIYDFVS